ncbi:MAG: helix-turn-helix domain-containing protein [Pseudomonadota bacterium]
MEQSTRQNTKTALVRSAERLFAEKGLGTVSVKDITRAAGARNPSAVHYHFGNVEALIREVFAQRYRQIEQDRLKRLALVTETEPKKRLLALMEAALAPFLETCLEEEGRLYVRFCVQFASDPRFDLVEMIAELGVESLAVLQDELIVCLEGIPPRILAVRLRQGFNISLLQAADYSRALRAGKTPALEDIVHEAAVSLSGYLSATAD